MSRSHGPMIATMPVFEGVVGASNEDAALLEASGAQALDARDRGARICAYGRIRFTVSSLAERARDLGLAETLLHAWREHGQGLLERIDGEYLIAAWSASERRALVAADRFSTLPLYFGQRDGRVAWAMRPARVCALLGIPAEIDSRAVHAYLWFHAIPAPLSIHAGVARLEGGQALAIRDGVASAHWHWQPRFEPRDPFVVGAERGAFMDAVRAGVEQCIEDVPRARLGCFLSGGTDSSTIAGIATQTLGAPARTFSIAFDVSGYDESRYSRLAAAHFGTEHTEVVLSADQAERTIDLLAKAYEQPFGNSSAVPTHVCARLAAEAGVTRMLGGDGGDELYGGNERYATQWLLSLYRYLPRTLRTGVLEPLLNGPMGQLQFWPVRKARGYVEQARAELPDRLGARYNLLNRFGAHNVLTAETLLAAGDFVPLVLEREVWARSEGNTAIDRLLAYDFKFTLADNDLAKVTRMCHAAGVEVGFPLLCDPVVRHAMGLPPGQKLRRTHLRYFFREALRGFLPDEIVDKPKHGFGMPFGEWLLSKPRLAERADDALAGLAGRGLIRAGFLDELRAAIHAGHAGYYGTMTWVLMMLELWLREHVDAHPASGVGAAALAEARVST